MILCQFQQFPGIWRVILQKALPGESAVEGHLAQKLVTELMMSRVQGMTRDGCRPAEKKWRSLWKWNLPVKFHGPLTTFPWNPESPPLVGAEEDTDALFPLLIPEVDSWEVNFTSGRCSVRFTGVQEETWVVCVFFFWIVRKCLWSTKNACNVSWVLSLANT